MMNSGLSASDVAVLSGTANRGCNDGYGFGGYGFEGILWLIVILAIFNGGWGNGFSTAELSRCNQQAALMQQMNNIQFQNQDCCCQTQRALERGFADVNYNMATQACDTRNTIQNTTRDILENNNSNTRAILDFLTNSEMEKLRAENQTLKFQASQSAQNAFITANQEAQTAELIRRLGADCPVPSYIVPNPHCCYGYGYGAYGTAYNSGCGCNSGCC